MTHKIVYIANPELFGKYRTYQIEALDFNIASLARPKEAITKKILASSIPDAYERARQIAANLGNVKADQVLFARNGTEALHYSYHLANCKQGDQIIVHADNYSTVRNYREFRDHGNSNKKDEHSTFADSIIYENYEGFSHITLKGNKVIHIQPHKTANIQKSILDAVSDNTRLVCLTDTLQQTGEYVDVQIIARQIKKKNPYTTIVVDGCQTLANKSQLDLSALANAGIDAYTTVAHKHFGSYPLGIMYVLTDVTNRISNLNNKTPQEQVLMFGMIPPLYSISQNVPYSLHQKRVESFIHRHNLFVTQNLLRDDSFVRKITKVNEIVSDFKNGVKNLPIKIIQGSPCILAIKTEKTEELFKYLSAKGVLCSYFEESNALRLSFSEESAQQTKQLVKHIRAFFTF